MDDHPRGRIPVHWDCTFETGEGADDRQEAQVHGGHSAGSCFAIQGNLLLPSMSGSSRRVHRRDSHSEFANRSHSRRKSRKPLRSRNVGSEDRDSFPNLVLLCKPHHTYVDKTHPERFRVEDLERWKAERESPGIEALTGLRGLTESRLAEIITDATQAALDKQDGRGLPVAWTEPAIWQINRRGVLTQAVGGWQLVVANDTDDLVAEWLAVTQARNGDYLAAAGSAAAHGVLFPRTRRVFDVPSPNGQDRTLTAGIPKHYPLDADTNLWFVERGHTWERRGGAAPHSRTYGGELFNLPGAANIAALARPYGLDRPGLSVRRVP